jgi:hypothetical protein
LLRGCAAAISLTKRFFVRSYNSWGVKMIKVIKLFSVLMAIALCAIVLADASTIIFEAGPFAIIADKNIEIFELGDLETWSTFGFEPITSRELIKDNSYELKMGTTLAKDESGLMSKYPMIIELSEKPTNPVFLFTPIEVKEITVGRINQINTTLYTGRTSNDLTPYFINFTSNGIYCTVYDPNTSETTITDFLKGFSVIRKADLGNFNLSAIWSENEA